MEYIAQLWVDTRPKLGGASGAPCLARCLARAWPAIGEEFLYCVKAAGFAVGGSASGRACGLRPVPLSATSHSERQRRNHLTTVGWEHETGTRTPSLGAIRRKLGARDWHAYAKSTFTARPRIGERSMNDA
jgi:hypothetical protein